MIILNPPSGVAAPLEGADLQAARASVRVAFERSSGSCSTVRGMTNSSSLPPIHQHTPDERARGLGVNPLPQSVPTLANRYRATCRDELALVSTFYRHPVAARAMRPGALDHTISLPDADGDTATIRTHRVRVPAGLVRDLSLRYPEYLMLRGQPVYRLFAFRSA